MIIKKFAWLPIRVTSGQKIWFAKYFLHRTLYDESTGRPPLYGPYFEWTETEEENFIRHLTDSVRHNRNIWNDPVLTKEDR